jgi:hypothetical protein
LGVGVVWRACPQGRYNEGMELTSEKRHPFQFRLRTLFLLIAAGSLILCLLVAAFNGVFRILEDPHGPVKDRTKWSWALKELLADAAESQIEFEPVQVYLSQASFFDCYYVWQLSGSPELLALMAQRWGLGPATASDKAQLWRDMPASWATPNATSSRRYLAVHVQDGDNLIVMIDDTSGSVYVWYWFDF